MIFQMKAMRKEKQTLGKISTYYRVFSTGRNSDKLGSSKIFTEKDFWMKKFEYFELWNCLFVISVRFQFWEIWSEKEER